MIVFLDFLGTWAQPTGVTLPTWGCQGCVSWTSCLMNRSQWLEISQILLLLWWRAVFFPVCLQKHCLVNWSTAFAVISFHDIWDSDLSKRELWMQLKSYFKIGIWSRKGWSVSLVYLCSQSKMVFSTHLSCKARGSSGLGVHVCIFTLLFAAEPSYPTGLCGKCHIWRKFK